ncbi:cytochrome c oxidase assembly protein [Mycetocola saprophilus]|uniref:cytochrome c oxidase assembly protein n=1 Tax=Mycetocola saprophilus TaxID=76636 RepID=UPI000A48ECA0|nr:cytochrome c oxidase assembly protein [Mycetocola saprophilus]
MAVTSASDAPLAPVPERTLSPRSPSQRLASILTPALMIALALVTLVIGLNLTGALSRDTALVNPGNLVLWGLPVARVMHDLFASVTIGMLLLATFILPGQKSVPGRTSRIQERAVYWAGWAAWTWFFAALAVLLFTAANTFGEPITAPSYLSNLIQYVTGIDLGIALALSLALVLVCAIITTFARRLSWVAAANAIGVLALLPLALSGHAAGTDEHSNAVNSLAVHIVGVTVWVGGLIAVLVFRNATRKRFPVVVERYSIVAGWAFAAVAFSGVVNASLRLTTPSDLWTTAYGQLLLVKIIILVLLGLAGARYRTSLIPKLRQDPASKKLFVRMIIAEVAFMAIAMGASVALSRSAPPVPQVPLPTSGEVDDAVRSALLGFEVPPPVTPWRMITEFHADWFWIGAAVVGAGLYIRTVLRLRKRGDKWPLFRTICWVLGCVGLIYVTSGGPGVYGETSFSTHMIQHMGLMMFVPPLLVLGGPVLLALRTLPVRTDGSRGLREWILVLVHSRYLKLLSHPAVAGAIFAGSLVVFYYSGWFEWSMFTHQGHFLMTVHFLASGYLFFWVLIGVDPGPGRPIYPLRLILLLATLAFHAFFGLSLMSATDILAEPWWTAMRFTDHDALLADQGVGGGIAWGAGEFPTVLVAIVVVVQWMRSEERAAKRYDRRADRDGDAELNAYNARLAQIKVRDDAAEASADGPVTVITSDETPAGLEPTESDSPTTSDSHPTKENS